MRDRVGLSSQASISCDHCRDIPVRGNGPVGSWTDFQPPKGRTTGKHFPLASSQDCWSPELPTSACERLKRVFWSFHQLVSDFPAVERWESQNGLCEKPAGSVGKPGVPKHRQMLILDQLHKGKHFDSWGHTRVHGLGGD